jgi:hypothetical protein
LAVAPTTTALTRVTAAAAVVGAHVAPGGRTVAAVVAVVAVAVVLIV